MHFWLSSTIQCVSMRDASEVIGTHKKTDPPPNQSNATVAVPEVRSKCAKQEEGQAKTLKRDRPESMGAALVETIEFERVTAISSLCRGGQE